MYKATIGLEVHAELKTRSKMFCGCENRPHGGEANAFICPVCMAHPGTVPVPNRAAIRSVLKLGVAVEGNLADYSEFDRKHYFYPDIPKAYQLSQGEYPLVSGGRLAGVDLTRVHIEEDTARSQHDKGEGSLVDFNRGGVPLMELVTEPVIHDAETAVNFAKELQLLLRTIGISDANMEKGEMRVEANISVSNSGQLGTKVEVKNLNSFKVVEQAINFEIVRQTELLEKGGQVAPETRGWDEAKAKTFSQRTKETADDYRYFPDPDIPKLKISEFPDFTREVLLAEMPRLPSEKRVKYSQIGLKAQQIETILQDEIADTFFRELISLTDDGELLQTAANYLLTDLLPLWTGEQPSKVAKRLSASHFLDLIILVKKAEITSRVAKDLLTRFAAADTDLSEVIAKENLGSSASTDDLVATVKEVLSEHEAVVEEYLGGKEAALQFLIGQIMKKTRGAANPAVAVELIKATISQ